jgi:hypothetical protein
MKSHETPNPLWSLADPLSVQQAAALLGGFDPNSIRFNTLGEAHLLEETFPLFSSEDLRWVQTAFAALVNAINGEKLKAVLKYDAEPRYTAGIDNLVERIKWRGESVAEIEDRHGNSYVITEDPNWAKTTITRADLVAWLERAGIRTGFFFPTGTDAPDYLDPRHPRYAPKLAAAVSAWQAVTDPGARPPKQALMKWLREHGADFGLTDDDGNPNQTGIEEIAKVANWQPGGGAPRTPGD